MTIEITDRNFKDLLSALHVTTSILEYTNDFVDAPHIATRARVWKKLENELLKQAHDQELDSIVYDSGDGLTINEEIRDKNLEVIDTYEELVIQQELASILAKRDFTEHYSETEIESMVQNTGGYIGYALHSFEEQYWKEFSEHGYYRLRIVGQGG